MPTENIKLVTETYLVKYMCGCGGEMIYTEKTLLSDPPQFQHKCDKCGIIEELDKIYPQIIIEYPNKMEV